MLYPLIALNTEIMEEKIKQFIFWKDNPKTPFETVYNGIDKSKPKIYYRKGMTDKIWTIEEVYDYWIKETKEK